MAWSDAARRAAIEARRRKAKLKPQTPLRKGFLQEWQEATQSGPSSINHITRVLGGVHLSAYPSEPHEGGTPYWMLTGLHNPGVRGKGLASAHLRLVTGLADRHGETLRLLASHYDDPRPHFSDKQLRQWYGRHGFVSEYSKNGKMMIRRPRKAA